MRKTIEISGKKIDFEATAMTDHMADKIFGINLTYATQHSSDELFPELLKKIAFIMAKRAELGGWRQVEALTPDDYYDWLDEVDSYAIESSAQEIMGLYANNKNTKVTPKNTTSPQAE